MMPLPRTSFGCSRGLALSCSAVDRLQGPGVEESACRPLRGAASTMAYVALLAVSRSVAEAARGASSFAVRIADKQQLGSAAEPCRANERREPRRAECLGRPIGLLRSTCLQTTSRVGCRGKRPSATSEAPEPLAITNSRILVISRWFSRPCSMARTSPPDPGHSTQGTPSACRL
jgi:hypothetical protein